MMKFFDNLFETSARGVARRVSRRSSLAQLGQLLVGAALVPVLPLSRVAQATEHDPGDPTQCDYWRYCGFDGFVCACCGGTVSQCPPGTSVSNVTWIGTCLNPAENKNSYNDCCGRGSCGQCLCNTNQGETPVYRPQLNNDIVWCFGAENMSYHCTIGAVLGAA
jgi:methylamine dehydrogenase light chain